MQPYSATEYAILTDRRIVVGSGLELLDTDDQLLGDISGQLVPAGSEVGRDNYAAVHGTTTLQLLDGLDWPNVRVRPYQTITAAAGTLRRNLGVYLLSTPAQTVSDEDLQAYTVEGYDKLHLLQRIIGDTYVLSGISYLDAVHQVLSDAGITGLPALLDGTAQDKIIPADDPMVWVLDEANPATWLRVVNDILKKIAYRGLWADQDGRFRSEPYQSPAVRPPEWTHDLANPRTNIVAPVRTLTTDDFEGFNWWRFIREGLETRPVEGNGRYTVDRVQAGELKRRRIERLQVADQDSLVARGDQLVEEDTRRRRALAIETGPLPILGHFDVTAYQDPKLGWLKVLTRTHTIPLDGGNVVLELEVV